MEDIGDVFFDDFTVAEISEQGRKMMLSSYDSYTLGAGCPEGYGRGEATGRADELGEGHGFPDDLIGYTHNLFPPRQVNGYNAYVIDELLTILTAAHGDFATGYIVQSDFQFKPCYVAKKNGIYAHGETLHEAYSSLLAKTEEKYSVEQRLVHFKENFLEWNVPYSNRSLFDWHNILTGSCRMGREQFCNGHGIDMDGQTTVCEFVELTKNSYGGQIIERLSELYNQDK